MKASELKFKKMGTAALLLKVEKLSGEEQQDCINVLAERGQDVSKWTVPMAPEPVSSATVFEAEPEIDLTEGEEIALGEAVAKADADTEKAKVNLKVAAAEHIKSFKKGSNGFNRINQITEGRKLEKLFDHELLMILAVPTEVVVAKPVVEKPAKPAEVEGDKPAKVEGEKKSKSEKFEGGSLEKYTLQFKDKVMTEDEIKALKTKREKVIACWFSGITDIAKIAVIADYAKGNVRGILHLSNLK
jgi:hypothetical protein